MENVSNNVSGPFVNLEYTNIIQYYQTLIINYNVTNDIH